MTRKEEKRDSFVGIIDSKIVSFKNRSRPGAKISVQDVLR
jgi:hypothetical protein